MFEVSNTSKGVEIDALLGEVLASLLKRFLDAEAHAFDGRTRLLRKVNHATSRVAIGKKVIDEEDVVVGREEVGVDADIVVTLTCETVHGRRIDIFNGVGLFLLDEHSAHLHEVSRHDGGCDAAGLDGDNLVDGEMTEETHKLFGNFHHEIGIKLVIDETIDLQNAAFQTATLCLNTFDK